MGTKTVGCMERATATRNRSMPDCGLSISRSTTKEKHGTFISHSLLSFHTNFSARSGEKSLTTRLRESALAISARSM